MHWSRRWASRRASRSRRLPRGTGRATRSRSTCKNIPVLFAFTGNHRDYHRPSDDTDRINFAGMARIADFAELLLLDVVRRPSVPRSSRSSAGRQRRWQPRLGRPRPGLGLGLPRHIPAYDDETKGVKLEGVREGSPAEKGGLKGGDIIVGFGGKPVATIYDYTESLGRFKPDDTVEVLVKRDGKDVTLKVTLGRRPE